MPTTSMRRNVSLFINVRLTLGLTPVDDPYMIKYIYHDKEGNTIRIKCDATKIGIKSRNKPGLARYAVVHPPSNNVNFVQRGEGTWGIRVRGGLVIEPGEECFLVMLF